MAIIIREKKELPNREIVTVKRYISDFSPLTGDLRKKAEEYDEIIKKKVREIESDTEIIKLIEKYRNRSHAIRMWYPVGKRLDFIEKFELSPTARKFVWRAIYDHTQKIYDKPRELPVRLLRAPTTSNLSYAYLIGRMDWEFVDAAGNWTAWVEFLDSEAIRNDKRIQNWIRDLQIQGPLQGGFLRILNKAIRRIFDGIDTPSLPNDRLIEKLEETLKEALLQRK